ncbi:MAG: DUF1802 family protein [Synechococcus sp.]
MKPLASTNTSGSNTPGFNSPGTNTLSSALKEWHVAVQALEAGETILLLRKGGIREEGGKFSVSRHRILLYPAYEHQKPHLLKPAYANSVQTVEPAWHPVTVTLSAWADIDPILELSQPESLKRLLPFHIWNEQFATDRLRWKPRQPLYLLLLRTHRLPSPVSIPYRQEYGGCRSWIDLAQEISLDGSMPVLDDDSYQALVQTIRAAIAPTSS